MVKLDSFTTGAARFRSGITRDVYKRQLLDSMSEKGIRVVTATAKEIAEVETEDMGMSRTEF